ncbi:MAG: hypothetical protein KGO02_09800 [Alphaproteobacteria bacterium]|nr:hypothetical protein [Alphaproteobacteria bacterium]
MSTSPSARNRAQSHFKSSGQRDDTIRAEIEKERAATDAKTARLKALRMAKEADDKLETDRQAAAKEQEKARIAADKAVKRERKGQG